MEKKDKLRREAVGAVGTFGFLCGTVGLVLVPLPLTFVLFFFCVLATCFKFLRRKRSPAAAASIESVQHKYIYPLGDLILATTMAMFSVVLTVVFIAVFFKFIPLALIGAVFYFAVASWRTKSSDAVVNSGSA